MEKVVLVDDHPALRRGMAELLEEMGWEVVSECGTIAKAKVALQQVDWTLAVLDLNLPDGTGFELLEWLRTEAGHSSPVLVHSVMPDAAGAARVFKLGGNGFLNKGASYEEFQGAARKVAAGGRYVSAEFAEELAAMLSGGPMPHEQLSTREYECMLLIAQGKTPGQVSETMDINKNTFSTYRARILRKLALSTSMDIMRYALSRRLVNI
ncbi:response regulator [Paraburkholderia sp. EG287A]|uniref:response regulator n=1 Tax=Paraburkholderia sp. EG287A TaxID=3237012 RepID=UPI0034D1B9C0